MPLHPLYSKGAISFGIIYAWTIGYNRPSKFRGGNARNMKEEFAVYGFPDWLVPVTRVVKLSLAVCLLFGYFFNCGQACRFFTGSYHVRRSDDAFEKVQRPPSQSTASIFNFFLLSFS